jgi:broad specificity phosphatase PhoE
MRMRRLISIAAFLVLASVVPAAAQTVFLVRHAERADSAPGSAPMMATDPDLSPQGRARAESLATLLKDAKITTIITTQYKRTRQTAEPLAKALGIEPTVVDAKDLTGFTDKVKNAKGNVLVVGHSNTVPDIIKQLGVGDAVTIGDQDFDNLFIIQPNGALLRLHYR